MPLYEYECPTHGRFEVSQRIVDAPLTVCTVPGCGQAVHKLISATSFSLKGGGWYSDGYQTQKKSAAAESSSPTPACGAGGCDACAAKADS